MKCCVNKTLSCSIIDSILNKNNNYNGLWVPKKIPIIDKSWLKKINEISNIDICKHIVKLYLSSEIDEDILDKITEEAINFDIPLNQLDDNKYILEFHGHSAFFIFNISNYILSTIFEISYIKGCIKI